MFSLCHGELHSFTKLWDETLVMVTFLHHSRHSTPATHQNKGEECTISNPIASSPSIITHIHMTQKWSKYACLSIEFEWHQFIILRRYLPFLCLLPINTHTASTSVAGVILPTRLQIHSRIKHLKHQTNAWDTFPREVTGDQNKVQQTHGRTPHMTGNTQVTATMQSTRAETLINVLRINKSGCGRADGDITKMSHYPNLFCAK